MKRKNAKVDFYMVMARHTKEYRRSYFSYAQVRHGYRSSFAILMSSCAPIL